LACPLVRDTGQAEKRIPDSRKGDATASVGDAGMLRSCAVPQARQNEQVSRTTKV
jgi:hypothetical protein